jgi:hypothetical protein
MDLFKAITGKNPAEFEQAAKILVDTPDVELFKKLVKQDDFLFDFVKNNVSKRIQHACNKDNFLNLFQFFDFYSASYDEMFAEVMHHFGGENVYPRIKQLYLDGSDAQKAYAAKYLLYINNNDINEIMPQIRANALSEYEPLSANSIELLSANHDELSKKEALERLKSSDEFEQYNSVKFLVTYGAVDALPDIFRVMKSSSLSENIAAEIPFLISPEDLLQTDFDGCILVMCNIISAIPEILPLSSVIDYNLFDIFKNLYFNHLTSSSALLLRMAKEKFALLTENDEYMFDCDKKTKDEIYALNDFFTGISTNKLNSLLYDELYDESDFVLFAVDYTEDVEELETLLDSKNQTLLLKVLNRLKEKSVLNNKHKELALENTTTENIRQMIELL